jgi:hypothetical protein
MVLNDLVDIRRHTRSKEYHHYSLRILPAYIVSLSAFDMANSSYLRTMYPWNMGVNPNILQASYHLTNANSFTPLPKLKELPAPPPKSAGATATWNDLPSELRLQILQHVSAGEEYSRHLHEYAVVCSEWRYFFEEEIFRNLSVNWGQRNVYQPDIGSMETPRLVQLAEYTKGRNAHRRAYVRHIFLRIDLGTYTCPDCFSPEFMAEQKWYV